MMITYLTGDEKQGCRELWEEAFPEDSREFGDYYFREKLRDNRILALLEEDEESLESQEEETSGTEKKGLPGRVQAMLHRNPYRLMVRGQQWQADYLVGVATRRDRRHRGYMRRLLLRMMADMRRERMPFCFLMPADEAIYRPFGFTFIFRQPWFVWTERGSGLRAERWIPHSEEASLQGAGRQECGRRERNLTALADWMNQWLARHYQVYALRDEAYLLRLAEELVSEEGTLEVFFDGEEIAAVESWWGRAQRERRLLYGEEPYVRKEVAEEKPAIMARIISPEEFVKGIRLRRQGVQGVEAITVSLRLQDPLIAENDGTWLWHLDSETSWLERTALTGEPELTLTIEELTAWLFGYEVPAAVGGLGDRIETLEGVFLDEVV